MFQEYLAAIAKKDELDTVAELLDSDFARWREVYALIGLINTPLATKSEAGRILAELYNPDPTRFVCADHRDAACANLSTPEGLLEYARTGFVPIAAKGVTFTMQAGRKSAGKVTLKENYLMAKTLVTYAQFETFVADPNGYHNDAHWTQAGLAWRKDRTAPSYWKDPKWHIANHPVIGVTWYESAAFYHWLTAKLHTVAQPFSQFDVLNAQFEVRLPSELEWEYAARRDTGRDYPWKRDANDVRGKRQPPALDRLCQIDSSSQLRGCAKQ